MDFSRHSRPSWRRGFGEVGRCREGRIWGGRKASSGEGKSSFRRRGEIEAERSKGWQVLL